MKLITMSPLERYDGATTTTILSPQISRRRRDHYDWLRRPRGVSAAVVSTSQILTIVTAT